MKVLVKVNEGQVKNFKTHHQYEIPNSLFGLFDRIDVNKKKETIEYTNVKNMQM